jgi:FdhD protein
MNAAVTCCPGSSPADAWDRDDREGAFDPAPSLVTTVQRWRDGRVEDGIDQVCEEVPVSLEYNGISHAVMLATPNDLEDLAVGFSLSEGIVGQRWEILDLEVNVVPRGVIVAMRITAQCEAALKGRRRTLAGRTGCGLCGVDSLDQVMRPIAPVASQQRVEPVQLTAGFAAMHGAQPLRALTGATHAAAWLAPDGRLLALREDVGRHNALDKTIGALASAGIDASRGAALVTSRASVEMVQKAAAAGIGLLAARSAPTALAIRSARALNLTLAGFVRGGDHVAYAHGWRLQPPSDIRGDAA